MFLFHYFIFHLYLLFCRQQNIVVFRGWVGLGGGLGSGVWLDIKGVNVFCYFLLLFILVLIVMIP